jgi:SAM-dependent methyltransferase
MTALTTAIYAPPRKITSLDDCLFYHTVDIPGFGLVEGQWDLRQAPEKFLGGVDVAGKRVLEIGTSDGFLAFDMERRGAEVVGYDISDKDEYDIVPYGGSIKAENKSWTSSIIGKFNNAWWLLHDAMQSKAHVVYGSVYDLPEEIGPFDVSTISCVLLHLRDPFQAMYKVGTVTKDTLIVTDIMPGLITPTRKTFVTKVKNRLKRAGRRLSRRFFFDWDPPEFPGYTFLPRPHLEESNFHTWWHLSPDVIKNYMKILGFSSVRMTFHEQYYCNEKRMISLYTLVGQRAK